MKGLLAVLKALRVFFILLNMLGGIASGIWLAILGDWWAIGYGLVALVVSTVGLGIALLPGIALGAGAAMVTRKSRAGIAIAGLLSNLYVVLIMTLWCVGVLYVFMSRSDSRNWIPLLVWSYGAATGPWSYMASQETRGGGGEASTAAAFCAQLAYLIMIIVGVTTGATFITLAVVFAAIMMVNVAFQVAIAYSLSSPAMSEVE